MSLYMLIDIGYECAPEVVAVSYDKDKLIEKLRDIAFENFSHLKASEVGDMLGDDFICDPDNKEQGEAHIIAVDLDAVKL